MTTHHQKTNPPTFFTKKRLAFIGYIFLAPPLVLAYYWFNTSNSLSATGRINAFLNFFPASIQNFRVIIFTSLICCIISLVLISRSFNQRDISIRIIDIVAAMLGAFVALLNLFQLF